MLESLLYSQKLGVHGLWISGLSSGNLSAVVFSATPGTISVDVTGFFQSLPLSLYIGECFTFDKCSILWDNTNGCCGNNKHFHVVVSASCVNTYPYLNNAQVVSIRIDQLEITEKIIGIKINVKDITDEITNVVHGLLTDYLTKEQFIPVNGTKVTLLQWVNSEVNALTQGKFTCPNSFEGVDIFSVEEKAKKKYFKPM